MMLDHLGEDTIAKRIRDAIRAVYAQGSVLTADIRKATNSQDKAATCTEFTNAVISFL
jgi:isocitrate dehydrogenase (NAD+)